MCEGTLRRLYFSPKLSSSLELCNTMPNTAALPVTALPNFNHVPIDVFLPGTRRTCKYLQQSRCIELRPFADEQARL
jgi:hypothetical protein